MNVYLDCVVMFGLFCISFALQLIFGLMAMAGGFIIWGKYTGYETDISYLQCVIMVIFGITMMITIDCMYAAYHKAAKEYVMHELDDQEQKEKKDETTEMDDA